MLASCRNNDLAIYDYIDKPFCAASSFCYYLGYKSRQIYGINANLNPEALFLTVYPDWTSDHAGPRDQIPQYVKMWKTTSYRDGLSGCPESEHNRVMTSLTLKKYEKISSENTLLFLDRVKYEIRSANPVIMDLPLYSSYISSFTSGLIQAPVCGGPKALGRHLVLIDGYNDCLFADKNLVDVGKGCLMVVNCWGTSWGMDGYGFVPYQFFTSSNMSIAHIFQVAKSESTQ